ncbi:MAG: hypothetical protein ACLTSX_02205 [Collinsella sp.]
MTNTTPDAGRASVPDPRPDAVEPQMGTGSAATSNPIPAIERNVDHAELEPGDTDTDPISVSAEVPESIEATIDFSEVELADEFARTRARRDAGRPAAHGALAHRGPSAQGPAPRPR